MKRILITGGAGFIGRNLTERLGEDYEIIAPTHRELELLDAGAVRRCIRENRIDAVVHAAVHVPMFNGPEREYENDMAMFENLRAVSDEVEKILYFGSGAEFDKRDHIRMVTEEDFGKRVPATAYGRAKFRMNQLARESRNICNLRLFGVFGKYELWQIKFLSNLCCKAVFGLPLTVRRDCAFDFLYIDDLADAVRWALDSDLRFHDYNVCHGRPYRLLELAETVRAVSGRDLEIRLLSPEENLDYTASRDRLRREAPELPVTPMAEAIRALYAYYDTHRAIIDYDILKESR